MNVGIYLENTFPTEVNDEGLINFFACAGNALNTKKVVPKIFKELFHSEHFKNRFCDGAEFIRVCVGSGLVVTVSEYVLQHTLVVIFILVGMRLITRSLEAPEASSGYVC